MKETFKTFKGIDNSFRKLKLFTLMAFALCVIVTFASLSYAYSFADKQRQKIYVLDQGKSLLLALQTDMVANREMEVADHVRRFHELFFTLAPNIESIEHNINAALNITDKRAYEIYNDLQEQGYYSRLISASISQSIIIDSVKLDMTVYPYKAATFARQYIVRTNSITVKTLNSTCELIDIARSDSNPHGLLIEKLEITDNTTIKESDR